MEKHIAEHYQTISQRLAAAKSKTDLAELAHYHRTRVQEFQHERLIHLLVTFFFAGLFLASLAAFFGNRGDGAGDELFTGTIGANFVCARVSLYSALLPVREWRAAAVRVNGSDRRKTFCQRPDLIKLASQLHLLAGRFFR